MRRNSPQVDFIEHQGLAAWVARASNGTEDVADAPSPQLPESGAAQPRHRDLILGLVQLVLGDRQEKRYDRQP